jgi:hypothetical protein
MKTIFRYLILAAACLSLVAIVQAQPCTSNVPSTVHIGNSYCFRVCPFQIYNIVLDGSHSGPDALPILIWETGCAPVVTNCDVVCTPIAPPSNFVYGGDPFYPNQWYGTSPCFNIHYYWVHDDIWSVVIWSTCNGCFCLTYEDQLSVELLDFSAVAGDGEVSLNWSTASETNNDGFEIVRDGVMIQAVDASGSTSGSNYSWIDHNVVNGTEYNYSLVSVDVSGNRETIATQSATPTAGNGVVSAYALHQNYPNPFNPETNISFDLRDAGFTTLKIYNLMGQEVATVVNGEITAGHHTVNFNGASLASGVYLYSLVSGEFNATKKLVLLK